MHALSLLKIFKTGARYFWRKKNLDKLRKWWGLCFWVFIFWSLFSGLRFRYKRRKKQKIVTGWHKVHKITKFLNEF